MAQLRDEQGNPIQLTDEFGNPVTLTDEHGQPMHLSGVAYSTDTPVGGGGTTVGEVLSGVPAPEVMGRRMEGVGPTPAPAVAGRSTSSSSSSSEEEIGEGEYEGGGRRRKKKGITQKLKEKLSFAKPKDKEPQQATEVAAAPHNVATSDTITQKTTVEHVEKDKGGAFVATDTTTTTISTEHRDQPKKGFVEKIMDKLPGHHTTH